jgi:hypothetical protein
MDDYMTVQIFSIVVAVVLMITFYAIAAGSLLTGANMITPLLLIILSVICLGILSVLTKIAKKLKA